MTVARFAVSFDPVLAKQIKKAAGKQPTSTWLADAAERKLRAEGLLDVVTEWEREHGLAELPAAGRTRRKSRKGDSR
jgi:hypothetical protein